MAGIAVAFVVGDMTGMQRIDVTETFPPAYDLWVLVILVAVAVMAIGVTEQTTWQLLLPTAAVGVAGYLVLLGGGLAGHRRPVLPGPGRRGHRPAGPGGRPEDGCARSWWWPCLRH